MNIYLNAILSIPKTIYFNLRVFRFKEAVHFLVLISYKCRMKKIFRNCIVIKAPLSFGMIRIGFGGTACVPTFRSTVLFSKSTGGIITFGGKAIFGEGVNIRNSGKIYIGKNFCSNANFRITCGSELDIGDEVLIGWNSSIRDSNGHQIICDGETIPNNKPVKIGRHVWIGAEAHILRGTTINDDSIVGFGSIVAGKFTKKNITIAGNPARVIKENVEWIL